ncbi:MAG: nucleotidyltransferase [Gemmatimonadetes bacterium]|nr:nucleotidyltransferase [Gemmatimonadota bacterium]
MSAPALVILAAGLSTRYGRLKQVDPMGPAGESIMDYNVFDAVRAGFSRVVFVVRPEIEDEVRGHVQAVVGGSVPVAYVQQTLDQVPRGTSAPPGRVKPWWTGHAVLCAARRVRGPFGVCNADDLYGAEAFRQLGLHLSANPPSTEAAMVGYTLSETLSPSGGVARGICSMGRDRLLRQVTEVRGIRRSGGRITGEGPDGRAVEPEDGEVVSMNLWGFSDPVVELLARQFRRFVERSGGDASAEFPLSTALGEQVRTGAVRVAVLPGGSGWFGVTHAADRSAAEATLRARIAAGDYPDNLAAAVRGERVDP